MLTAGSCATRTYEPCQVRKEAAISKHLRVPWECLVRANCLGNVRKVQFGNKCMTFIFCNFVEHIENRVCRVCKNRLEFLFQAGFVFSVSKNDTMIFLSKICSTYQRFFFFLRWFCRETTLPVCFWDVDDFCCFACFFFISCGVYP